MPTVSYNLKSKYALRLFVLVVLILWVIDKTYIITYESTKIMTIATKKWMDLSTFLPETLNYI